MPKFIELNDAEVVRMYVEDLRSGPEIALSFGVSAPKIMRVLKLRGIAIRNNRESARLWMSKRTPEEILAHSLPGRIAADNAKRGVRVSDEWAINRAKGFQRSHGPSRLEAVFLEAFSAAGLSPVVNLAVHRYNCDFGFEKAKIDVEIDPDWGHRRMAEHDARRDEFLRGIDWTVIRWTRHDGIRRTNKDLKGTAARLVAEFKERYAARL